MANHEEIMKKALSQGVIPAEGIEYLLSKKSEGKQRGDIYVSIQEDRDRITLMFEKTGNIAEEEKIKSFFSFQRSLSEKEHIVKIFENIPQLKSELEKTIEILSCIDYEKELLGQKIIHQETKKAFSKKWNILMKFYWASCEKIVPYMQENYYQYHSNDFYEKLFDYLGDCLGHQLDYLLQKYKKEDVHDIEKLYTAILLRLEDFIDIQKDIIQKNKEIHKVIYS